MFLFIFESIGTSELIFIGIIALIFLGPRRLPEMARKLGKIMADLRSTTSEFRQTWEREVNFEEEAKALRTGDLSTDLESTPIARETGSEPLAAPEIRPIDRQQFEAANVETEHFSEGGAPSEEAAEPEAEIDTLSDKRTWL